MINNLNLLSSKSKFREICDKKLSLLPDVVKFDRRCACVVKYTKTRRAGKIDYLAKKKKELAHLPEGNLVIRNGCYYHRIDGKDVGISKDHNLIEQLARKRYLQMEIPIMEKNLSMISEFNTKYETLNPEKIIEKMPKAYQKLPKRYFFGTDEINAHQSENPYKREQLIYKTNSGVYMRTKSEVIIGNFLESHGIKYLYEAKFLLRGRWVYPDFLIENQNDYTIIPLEHLGMIGDPGYEKHNKKKLKDYIDDNYFPGHNLICTYEQDIMEPGRLESILHLFGII